ncbi:MAG TPA: hypothetical protein ENG70_01325 [Candidatus Cloacimonetes bacterium]|nr:hypothetical protein [Candidatus Cloacimonadota bacterium]HEX37490.1 hypothetical protein [Candidatus Cloacimonadota bacterium]
MLKELTILKQLQDLDDNILRNKKEIDRLPKIVQDLHEKYSSEKESVKNITQRLEQNLASQRKLELDISSNNQDINKYENQLLSVKTNKEYKALNSEITHRKERNVEIEEKLIEFMEEESVLREEKNKFEELYQKDQKLFEEEKAKIDKQIQELEKKVSTLEAEKDNLAKEIPELLYRKYQRLIEHNNGKAVATLLKNGTCSGCHFTVRPQIMVEVSKGDKIIICENCSRIIVAPE